MRIPWEWWWESLFLEQIQAAFSILGAILAGLALGFAWWVARQQFVLMKRSEETAEKLAKIELDNQYAAATISLLTKPVGDGEPEFEVWLENTSSLTLRQYTWQLMLADRVQRMEILTPHDVEVWDRGAPLPSKSALDMVIAENDGRGALLPGESTDLATIRINPPSVSRLDALDCWWVIKCDYGSISREFRGSFVLDIALIRGS